MYHTYRHTQTHLIHAIYMYSKHIIYYTQTNKLYTNTKREKINKTLRKQEYCTV